MHQGRRRVCSEAEGTGAMIGEKLTAAAEVCCACHLPQAMRKQVRERMAAAVLCWWEGHGAAPTDTSPQAVLQVLDVACPCETAAL